MSKSGLMKLKKNELEAMCEQRGLPYGKKADMADMILAYDNTPKEVEEETVQESKAEGNAESECTPWVMGGKDDVINEADPGTLVAFLDQRGKPRTAKLVHRSATKRKVQVVTEYDWEFTVDYDKILWVRKGTRWPKAVYNMLKGYKYGRAVSVTYEK